MSDAESRRSRRLLAVLGAAVGAVVLAAILAVFLRGEPAELDAATPEGVVQRYTQAVLAGDADTALSYVVDDVADDCDPVTVTEDRRVTLVDASENGETARVEVRVATVYGQGPFGPSEYETDGVFVLEGADGAWLIRSAPWELSACEGMDRDVR